MKPIIPETFFSFFKGLAANNNKEWFDAHKKEYESEVKKPFESLVAELIGEMQKTDKNYNGLLPKDCAFRINRDVRFSNDKTPYKLNRSAIIAPGGKKTRGPAGFYFEIGPGECAFYSGAYMPEKPELYAFRRAIADRPEAFDKIIKDKKFVSTFGEVLGNKNKRLDSEFSEASKVQPLIFNTQFYIQHLFKPEDVLKPDFVSYIIKLNAVAAPFAGFLEGGLNASQEK